MSLSSQPRPRRPHNTTQTAHIHPFFFTQASLCQARRPPPPPPHRYLPSSMLPSPTHQCTAALPRSFLSLCGSGPRARSPRIPRGAWSRMRLLPVEAPPRSPSLFSGLSWPHKMAPGSSPQGARPYLYSITRECVRQGLQLVSPVRRAICAPPHDMSCSPCKPLKGKHRPTPRTTPFFCGLLAPLRLLSLRHCASPRQFPSFPFLLQPGDRCLQHQ